MNLSAIILAAGQGTRMKSNLPKVLHQILGQPMAWYALDTARQVIHSTPLMVIGHGADQVRQGLGDQAEYVLQVPQLGTGHAVMQAESLLTGKSDLVLVTYADMPLLTTETLSSLVEKAQSHTGPISMLTVTADEPRGFGRILRDSMGQVSGIVEEAQATTEQLNIHELNPGVYCFRADWLWQALKRIQLSPKGEYYLTDLVSMAVAEGHVIQTLCVEDPNEVIGINTRLHLAQAETLLRQRINQQWMLAGVYHDRPGKHLYRAGGDIGARYHLVARLLIYAAIPTSVKDASLAPTPSSRIPKLVMVARCWLRCWKELHLEDHVEMGPYCHLRKGAHLSRGVHMGNFGEVKNSTLGPGAKMGHFSYLGDATVGAHVNIGAGTITCNYDGLHKFPTEIGEGAFIGSDTMLVAPVKVGEGAKTGAGAVVTKDIPPYTLAVGVPARVIRKLEK